MNDDVYRRGIEKSRNYKIGNRYDANSEVELRKRKLEEMKGIEFREGARWTPCESDVFLDNLFSFNQSLKSGKWGNPTVTKMAVLHRRSPKSIESHWWKLCVRYPKLPYTYTPGGDRWSKAEPSNPLVRELMVLAFSDHGVEYEAYRINYLAGLLAWKPKKVVKWIVKHVAKSRLFHNKGFRFPGLFVPDDVLLSEKSQITVAVQLNKLWHRKED